MGLLASVDVSQAELDAHTALITGAHGEQRSVMATDMADITANTTLQNIADATPTAALGLAIGASSTERWLVQWYLLITAAVAGPTMDGKFALTLPSGATAFGGQQSGAGTNANSPESGWSGIGVAVANGSLLQSLASQRSFGLTTGLNGIAITAVIKGGGTAGTAQPQIAQNTSDANILKVLAGSCMLAWKTAA